MNATALTLLIGLLRTIGLGQVAFSIVATANVHSEFSDVLLTRAARKIRAVSFSLGRTAEPIVNAAYLLALALRDHLTRPGTETQAELERCIAQARGVVAPKTDRLAS